MGVVGCGSAPWIGHLPWYRVNTRAELVAVADIGELRARVAGDYSHAETHYTGYERPLKREGVDAVSVCAHLHAEQVVAALEHSKHVLAERPMARDLVECNGMIRAAGKTAERSWRAS